MSGRSGRAATFMLVLLVVSGIGGLLWWLSRDRDGDVPAADLFSVNSDVTRKDARSGTLEAVPASEHRDMWDGDLVTVDTSGRARLDLSGAVMEVYRTTELTIESRPDLTAPVSAILLTHGAILVMADEDTTVGTDWAKVTIRGTECLVYVNDRIGLLWVVVRSGTVEIEAAGRVIVVSGGEQAWVWRGDPPVGPVPAERAQVPNLGYFPLIPELTNGELADDYLLEPGGRETPGVAVTASTTEVLIGKCPGDHSLEVTARLTGPDEAIAQVARVEISYGWDGRVVDAFDMDRVSERSLRAEIVPRYDGDGTTLEFRVAVLDGDGADLAGEGGEVSLRPCPVIGTVIPIDPTSLVPGVSVSQDVERLYSGECPPGEPHPTTLTVTATLTGSDLAVGRVASAEIAYRWPNGPSAAAAMKRVDDRTFQVEIEPTFWQTSVLDYTVTVRDSARTALASASWTVALEACGVG